MYLTTSEVADHYKVSVDTVYRWISRGLFRDVIKIGDRYRIPSDSLGDVVKHVSGFKQEIERII